MKTRVMISVVSLLICASASAQSETLDDARLLKALHKSQNFKNIHQVMAGQGGRMHAMLDGYLTGSLPLIEENANGVSKAMKDVFDLAAKDMKHEPEAWHAMASIVDQAELVRYWLRENDYNKSFEAYSRLSQKCLQCHQITRDWGRLPEPAKTPDGHAAGTK